MLRKLLLVDSITLAMVLTLFIQYVHPLPTYGGEFVKIAFDANAKAAGEELATRLDTVLNHEGLVTLGLGCELGSPRCLIVYLHSLLLSVNVPGGGDNVIQMRSCVSWVTLEKGVKVIARAACLTSINWWGRRKVLSCNKTVNEVVERRECWFRALDHQLHESSP